MHISEIGRGGYRQWERKASSNQINTTNNHIISTKLFIFCATFTICIFILNFIIIHVHVNLIITLLTITEFWIVTCSSDTSAFIFIALGWNTFAACCLQNLVRCDFYSSWNHGRSQLRFSFISLPTIFTWIQLGWITYYTVFPHDCNMLW